MATRARIAVLGASGYTGAETLRLALRHPDLEVRHLTAERQAGKAIGEVFPQLADQGLPTLVKIADVPFDAVDAVVCCLPHGTTQEVVAALPTHLKVVDVSADFRLADPQLYAQTYGRPHGAPELQKEAVYGLTERAREAVRAARLVANPGCYPTGPLLALEPLLHDQAIEPDGIVIDAKSGVSGAGRSAKESLLFAEVNEGMHAYAIGGHRHLPEIEQGLSDAAGEAVRVSFTPHLVPMSRGELVTCHVRLTAGASAADLRSSLDARYRAAAFAHLLPEGRAPATQHVRGSNHFIVNVFADRLAGRAIVIGALDNLVKGSAGQALQNFNLMFGLPETTGLEQQPLFP
jgi:N-acetyl-gamma-glutamyl-phosphate reductase